MEDRSGRTKRKRSGRRAERVLDTEGAG